MPKDEEQGDDEEGFVGFAGVASFIASDKEHSSSVYRRYEKLAARNLLYLQTELREIELQLDEFDREDARGEVEEIGLAMDWQALRAQVESKKDSRSREAQRKKLVYKLRAKIKEYQDAVLQNAQMLELRRPSRQVHRAFNDFFNNNNNNNNNNDKEHPFPKLAGISADLYDNRSDLISLVSTKDEDRLTTLLREHCPSLFLRRRETSQNAFSTAVRSLSEYRLSLAVGLINIVVAAGMLFGAIYNLYYVQDKTTRLGLVAGYTVAFALCVGLFTNARRSEIFGTCAAYAAVLVVFVSGNLGN